MKKSENKINKKENKKQPFLTKQGKREIRWERLDNTAHLFPVIAGEKLTNTYRIAVELTEDIIPEKLQEALDKVLPKFDLFNVRMRTGFFWYYFEENNKKAPRVKEESTYPCRYIVENRNHSYMFRVTYFKKRINLEVFHVLTDGMGGINFIRELTYQYLRLVHPEINAQNGDALSASTSLNREDSFLKNYKRASKRNYGSKKAFTIKGELMSRGMLGFIHGFMDVSQLKDVAHRYNMSINEFLVGTYVWSIYKIAMHGFSNEKDIRVAVPVNLRPYFDSVTTKNFFVMVLAELKCDRNGIEFEDVLNEVKKSLRSQITKEHLEETFSYNVSNQQPLAARLVPLFLKNIAIGFVYNLSADSSTSTMTNIGSIDFLPEYDKYVKTAYANLTVSRGQYIRATVASCKGRLCVSFSSLFADAGIERAFFSKLAEEGIDVSIETNGVYR